VGPSPALRQTMLEESEKQCMEVRLQNDELVERIVGEKSKNAEEMNKMNALIEQMRAALRAQGVRVGGVRREYTLYQNAL
jgi:hypothetical protein